MHVKLFSDAVLNKLEPPCASSTAGVAQNMHSWGMLKYVRAFLTEEGTFRCVLPYFGICSP